MKKQKNRTPALTEPVMTVKLQKMRNRGFKKRDQQDGKNYPVNPVKKIAKLLLCLLVVLSPAPADPDDKTDKGSFSVVKVREGLLTVKVRNIPLKRVLEEIAGQTEIKLVFNGQTEAMISADIADIPLEKGLRRLIRDMNYAFIYGPKETKSGRSEIREIIIYTEADGSPFKAIRPPPIRPPPAMRPPERPEEAPPESLFDALRDGSPEVREEAVHRHSKFGKDKRVVKHLTETLLFYDEKVKAGEEKTPGDPRERSVKMSIVKTLREIGGEGVIRTLKRALKDEDEDVRKAAAESLEILRGKPDVPTAD